MGGTPYWLVLPAAVGWLAYRHASSSTASDRSRRTVAWLTGATVLLMLARPVVIVPASIVLAGVGAYVLLHREVSDHIEKTESDHLPRK
ncbi:MAG: hypothetical protein J0I06_23820 [Planctomycetes bacterium]|nr:hypothetical protein [Planctomycetota bacterium]